MKILKLELENIRNFQKLRLDFDDSLTIIYGGNAEGKTNLLEAIYFLNLTKYPRKIKEREVLLKGEETGRIKGIFRDDKEQELEVEFILGREKIGKINKSKAKIKDVLGQALSIFFTAENLKMIDAPEERRRFLNILLSLLDRKYFFNLLEYKQALKRRNKTLTLIGLKKSQGLELDFWDQKIATLGSSIVSHRNIIISKINKLLEDSPMFFKKSPLRLIYNAKDLSEELFLKELKKREKKDVALGQTTFGPHRDIIKLEANNLDLEIYGSRGEKRAAVIELKKTEAELLKKEKGVIPILLLDDVFSELDKENRDNVLGLVGGQQTIITITNPNYLKEVTQEARVYKIEKGEIKKQ